MPRGERRIRYMGRMQTSAGYCLLCFGGHSGNVLIIRFFSQTGSVCSKWYEERWRGKKRKKKKKNPLFYLINPSFPSLHSHCWRLQGQQPIDWNEARTDEGWWTGLLLDQRKTQEMQKTKQKKEGSEIREFFCSDFSTLLVPSPRQSK